MSSVSSTLITLDLLGYSLSLPDWVYDCFLLFFGVGLALAFVRLFDSLLD